VMQAGVECAASMHAGLSLTETAMSVASFLFKTFSSFHSRRIAPRYVMTASKDSRVPLSYAAAGVDIDAGDALVDRIKPLAKRTMRPEVLGGIGGFGALFECRRNTASRCWCPAPTASAPSSSWPSSSNKHDTVGQDLVAMSVNDILVQGAEPLFFLDYFACGKLDVDTAADVVKRHRPWLRTGRLRADRRRNRRDARHVPGGRIRPRRLSRSAWSKRPTSSTAATIAEGDVVLGLASSGAHSNGYSLIRKIIERAGRTWTPTSTAALRDVVMEPTRIYVKPLLALMKEAPGLVKGMAHITGGGCTENVPRVLPAGLPRTSMRRPGRCRRCSVAAEAGNVAEQEMYRVFNCGIGMVVIVAAADADRDGGRWRQVARPYIASAASVS
jgi:phosphoribosylformylglycinamidine cyclo-ligase